jgi:hypothetical protein
VDHANQMEIHVLNIVTVVLDIVVVINVRLVLVLMCVLMELPMAVVRPLIKENIAVMEI